MKNDLQAIIGQFLKILHLYSVIARKPKDYGTGDLLYFTEIHTISMVGRNNEINMTGLAEMMGVTKGAISQTVRKLAGKGLIIKSNSINRKEFNLRLSGKGEIVNKGIDAFQSEIFTFAESLYEKARPEDIVLVKRLFDAICGNMEERVRQL